jgi:energy-coupling factor transporter ATP-binding protein EcfA2
VTKRPGETEVLDEGGAHAEQEPGAGDHTPPGPLVDGEPAKSGPAPPAPPIRATDRVCALGMTGSGKSTLLAQLWSIYPGQRLFIDVNDRCELGPDALADERGACLAERVRDIDWRARTIMFTPRSQSDRLYNDLYAAIFDRGRLCVQLDECYGPTTANRAPEWLRRTIQQGRKEQILHLAASQEPVNILPVIYSQAEHLMVCKLAGRRDDLNAIGLRLGLTIDELQRELETLPDFGYLRHSMGVNQPVRRMPPLPPDVVAHVERHVLFVV